MTSSRVQACLRVLTTASGGAAALRDVLRVADQDPIEQWIAARVPPPRLKEAAERSVPLRTLLTRWSELRSREGQVHAAGILAAAHRARARILTLGEDEYPPLLRSIPDPPPLLFIRGALPGRDDLVVAVVGTRRATRYGRVVAERIAGDLASAGAVIVSGLARGVDAVAHESALAAGGRTVAVLGTGIDVCYPPEHHRLAGAIAASGALVTELLPGALPLAHHFPARNRILSGLCHAVVVVEGTVKSGALVTARAALEQGREVCAVPGDVTSAGSAGPHALLKDGAALVECAEDVVATVRSACSAPLRSLPRGTVPVPALPPALEPHIDVRPRTLDDLVDATGLPASNLAAMLERLTLAGVVERDAGGGYCRPVQPRPGRETETRWTSRTITQSSA